MKVLFTGGGTAGHINPALAAAGYLLQKEPDAQILYVGNKGGMEERLVPRPGTRSEPVHISGFQRKLTPKNLWRNAQTVVRVFTATPRQNGSSRSLPRTCAWAPAAMSAAR